MPDALTRWLARSRVTAAAARATAAAYALRDRGVAGPDSGGPVPPLCRYAGRRLPFTEEGP